MRIKILDVRQLDENTAIVLTEGGVSKKKAVPLDKVQTFVMQRQSDGRWLCSAFQNTKKRPLLIWISQRGTGSTEPNA